MIRKWKRRMSRTAGRVQSELVQPQETVWKIRMMVGQGKVVRGRKGKRLELDEGSTEAPWWAERLFRRKLWGRAGAVWQRQSICQGQEACTARGCL